MEALRLCIAKHNAPTQPLQQGLVLQDTVFPATLYHAPGIPATARGRRHKAACVSKLGSAVGVPVMRAPHKQSW